MPGRGDLRATVWAVYVAPGCKSTVMVARLQSEVTVLIMLLPPTLSIRNNRDKIGASDAGAYYVQ